MVDLLATVPSIVYGFWGLELISKLQAPTAKWLVDHVSFVPFFRTPTPDAYVNSVFAVQSGVRGDHHPDHHLGQPGRDVPGAS